MSDDIYVLGIDSGGTKTICTLATATGLVRAVARGRGMANIADDRDVVMAALRDTIQDMQEPPEWQKQVVSVYVCLGGLNTAIVEEVTRSLFPEAKVRVQKESSGEVFTCGARHWNFDVAVMAGTGSIAQGLGPAGQHRVVGGWGPLFHDRGSGYTIGRQALRAVADNLDFGASPSILLRNLLTAPPFADRVELNTFLTAGGLNIGDYAQRLRLKEAMKSTLPELDRRAVARLFPVVLKSAEEGDPAATGILDAAAFELAEMACSLTAQLGLTSPRVLPLGGIFTQGGLPLRLFREKLSSGQPDAIVVESDFTLGRGALVLAHALADIPVTPTLIAAVNASAAAMGA